MADLEQAMETAAAAAREAWRDLDVRHDAFIRHLRGHLPEANDEALAALRGGWHVQDLYLAFACAGGCPVAVAALDRMLASRAPLFLARIRGAGPGFVDEVRQVMLEKLLVAAAGAQPKITSYSGRGAFEGWLRIATVNTALKLLRKPDAEPRVDESAALHAVAPAPDPELAFVKQHHREDFEHALRDAFAALEPKARNVLRLHFVDGLTIDGIGAAYGAHRATAARWLQDARRAVLEGTRKALRERLKLTPTELESMVQMLRSRLDRSVRELLATVER
jgi:RNA polymerase sigma-70 factor (ECF subfamily)